jgi:hypothetical protein
MKIERLELKAFGCFRDFTLDFSSTNQNCPGCVRKPA